MWGNRLDVWPAGDIIIFLARPLRGCRWGDPGLQDNRFHTSTHGFCEGLLNARPGRPQKEVTTADSGVSDIPLDPSRCWPWTTCCLKTAGLQGVPPVLRLSVQNLYPQRLPRPSTLDCALHAPSNPPRLATPFTKPHPLWSATPPKGGAALHP